MSDLTYYAAVHPATGLVHARGSTRSTFQYAVLGVRWNDESFCSRLDLAQAEASRSGRIVVPLRQIDARTYRAIKAAKGVFSLDSASAKAGA